MKALSMLCCVAWLAAAGCQQDEAPAPASAEPGAAEGAEPGAAEGAEPGAAEDVDPVYAKEIGDICFGEERSGALSQPEAQRAVAVAQWLGTRIHSEEARALLVSLSQAAPAQKAAMLEAEAARVGLDSCPLAGSWGGAPASEP